MSDSDSDAENEAEDQNVSPPSPPPPQVIAYFKMKFNSFYIRFENQVPKSNLIC